MNDKLIKARNDRGYTQQQIADAVGIDRSTYAHYEQSGRTPYLNTAFKIASFLNKSVEDIFLIQSVQNSHTT